ncbi:MAG: endonuclease [Chlorobi bacterium]|nr:endonuclease [Chlorobiota bacterium]
MCVKFLLPAVFLLISLPEFLSARTDKPVRILFYNTENFFDPYDDSLTLDEEFTPDGERHWTRTRFIQKANHLYKVFMAAGDWTPPEMIGLAEVENEYVLHYLVAETPFSKFGYRFVHFDSPDKRGIDVALLFNPSEVEILTAFPVSVTLPKDYRPTRDILYADVLVGGTLPLHLFVNHWPSRTSGYLETEELRIAAARTIHYVLDTLIENQPGAKVIVMGDFNDEPDDQSIQMIGHPVNSSIEKISGSLVNLMTSSHLKGEGTLFYNDRWWLFDQFLVSRNLTVSGNAYGVVTGYPEIFRPDFLLTGDDRKIPYRTFRGFTYTGGFSDHLPILIKIK